MLSLTSSPEFIENRRQESARPVFPHPWTKENKLVEVSIPEELPAGSIIYSLPAINPKDGSPVPITVQGDMKEAFSVDPDTGAISIAHSLDFESMAPNDRTFSLTFTAGSPGYESVAELKITVTNVDDNPPALDKEGPHNEVAIPENLPPSTVIARLGLTDADDLEYSGTFSVEKSGFGSELYAASIVNGTLVVSVAENATLDREKMERQTVHLRVKDGAGNQDSAT
ncbi:cadherin domain protein, partial [Ancylostoma caninum]